MTLEATILAAVFVVTTLEPLQELWVQLLFLLAWFCSALGDNTCYGDCLRYSFPRLWCQLVLLARVS